MPPATIETERLWLRQPHMTDLDALAAIYADSEVMRFIKDGTRPRPQTEETLHALIDEWEHNKIGVWMVIEKYTEHLLGICGFVGQAELGYIFAKSAWGIGIATEAARACKNMALKLLAISTSARARCARTAPPSIFYRSWACLLVRTPISMNMEARTSRSSGQRGKSELYEGSNR